MSRLHIQYVGEGIVCKYVVIAIKVVLKVFDIRCTWYSQQKHVCTHGVVFWAQTAWVFCTKYYCEYLVFVWFIFKFSLILYFYGFSYSWMGSLAVGSCLIRTNEIVVHLSDYTCKSKCSQRLLEYAVLEIWSWQQHKGFQRSDMRISNSYYFWILL